MAAPVVPTYLVANLAAQVRLESDLNSSQVFSDQQIATLISDAGSSLRDVFTGANQLYDVSTFAFTLVGGVGQNATNLPADFQQGHSVDVNPGTSQPYTLRYLPNWLDRNRYTNASPFSNGVTGGGPREYHFLGSGPGQLIVLPAMSSAGNFLLYYTPMWKPLSIPTAITVGTATVPITVDGTTTGMSSSAFLNAPSGSFIAADVGDFVTITGAVNSNNNGTFTIVGFTDSSRVTLQGTHTPETFPITATVTLSRQSSVTAGGLWTFYGANQFTQTTGAINVGDTINVSGAVNVGNNGSFIVLSVGPNTVTTAATGLVAEQFATGTVAVTSQLAGTRPDLPAIMNPWILYLKTMACITIRNKRGQDVESFMARLNVDQQRIEKILQSRQDEPEQPPLTRGGGYGGYGGCW